MRKHYKTIIISIVGLMLSVFMVGAFWQSAIEEKERALERYTYIGKVTAVETSSDWSVVYLNSNSQVVKVKAAYLDLAVGEEYEVIIDGNYRLINARIIEGRQ